MKILVISEENLSTHLLNSGNISVITYRSYLKALDNLAEISPSVVLINAVDYKEHWKVVLQYISFYNLYQEHSEEGHKIGEVFYLYIDDSFSEADKKEAKILGVSSFLHNEAELKKALLTCIDKEKDGKNEGKRVINIYTLNTVDNLFSAKVEKTRREVEESGEEDFLLLTADNLLSLATPSKTRKEEEGLNLLNTDNLLSSIRQEEDGALFNTDNLLDSIKKVQSLLLPSVDTLCQDINRSYLNKLNTSGESYTLSNVDNLFYRDIKSKKVPKSFTLYTVDSLSSLLKEGKGGKGAIGVYTISTVENLFSGKKVEEKKGDKKMESRQEGNFSLFNTNSLLGEESKAAVLVKTPCLKHYGSLLKTIELNDID